MRVVAALVRAGWRTARTYRLDLVLSVGGLLVSIVPVYFIADALHPTMAASIRGEGGEYFAFLVVGMVAFSFVSTAVTRFPGAIGSAVRTGTLEALFSTPARIHELLAGLSGYGFLWTAAKGALFLLAAWVLGAEFTWGRLPTALFLLALIVAAHLPFGLMAAASQLAFRTAGPMPKVVIGLSALLGGVYYPTRVIPGWLEGLSAAFPLTYGLRALRQTLLEGRSLAAVAGDLAVLLVFTAGLTAIGLYAFRSALGYARRCGTLAQY